MAKKTRAEFVEHMKAIDTPGRRERLSAKQSEIYVCENKNCKQLMINGVARAGRGVEKEFREWSPVGKQMTPGCISCDKPMRLKEVR